MIENELLGRVEKRLDEAVAIVSRFSEKERDHLNKEIQDTIETLESSTKVMGNLWICACGRQDYKEKDDKRGDMIRDFFQFEIKMCKEFGMKVVRLDSSKEEDRQKFHLWNEIVQKADKICIDAKEEFSHWGFNSPLKIREEIFKTTVRKHKALLYALDKYQGFLPKNTNRGLKKVLNSLKGLEQGVESAVEEEKKLKSEGQKAVGDLEPKEMSKKPQIRSQRSQYEPLI